MGENVSLRDYFEEKLKHVDEKFRSRDENLALQAKEYERRLDGLNGEASRIKASQEESISVDKFDGFVKEFNLKIDQNVGELRKEINTLEVWKTKQETGVVNKLNLERYIPWALTAATIIMMYLMNKK